MNKSPELVGISHEELDGKLCFSQRWLRGTAVVAPLLIVLFIGGIIFGLYKLTGGVELSLETPLVALMVLPVVYGAICLNHLIAVFLNKTRLLYSNEGVQVKHGPWPSVGYAGLRLDVDKIKEFEVKGIDSEESSKYSVVACDWRGKTYELIRDIEDKNSADFIVGNLTETLNLADQAVPTSKHPGIGTTLVRHLWSCILFLTAILFIGYALNLRQQQIRRMHSFTETKGILVDYVSHVDDVRHKPTHRPVYEYRDKSGNRHKITSRIGTYDKDPLGSKLTLRYNPDKPDKAFLPGNFDSHAGPTILIWSWGFLAILYGGRLLYILIKR